MLIKIRNNRMVNFRTFLVVFKVYRTNIEIFYAKLLIYPGLFEVMSV